jgi:hypothetical protein
MAAANPILQPVMAKLARLSWEENFMRPVTEQVADEVAFYHEEFNLLLDELAALPPEPPILAEGCAWLPELLERLGVSPMRAAFLVSSMEFQADQYAGRPYVQPILQRCEDPATAFRNWMERDAAFGEMVLAQAAARGMTAIRVDGTQSLEEIQARVEKAFGF